VALPPLLQIILLVWCRLVSNSYNDYPGSRQRECNIFDAHSDRVYTWKYHQVKIPLFPNLIGQMVSVLIQHSTVSSLQSVSFEHSVLGSHWFTFDGGNGNGHFCAASGLDVNGGDDVVGCRSDAM
jgi:hypothetical protein